MITKSCRKCNKRKPLSKFCIDKSRKDGHGYVCKHCYRAYQKERYWSSESIRKQQLILAQKRAVRNRLFIREYLSSHPCVDCGETDPIVLDFDHVRGEKVDNIATMTGKGRALSVIKKEIAKCEVRCANCHRRKTWKELGYGSYL